jgi:SRSO17 transposase
MERLEEGAVAAPARVDPAVWVAGFDDAFAVVAGVFPQVQSRRRARAYLLGLLSQTERKNGWSLAEFAGDDGPDGMQRLLNFYPWDADAARDAVRRYVVSEFGHPNAVLVADETGFVKKGRASVGVQRQYSGTAGRVENCQLGVFLAYATPDGARALIDRAVYLPESWTADAGRCERAGVPEDAAFATKPELTRRMIKRALAAGVPFGWVTADEAYGQNPGLRTWLEEQDIAYAMAVPCSFEATTAAGRRRADALAALVPAGGWQRLSCGQGAKGPRRYDWALMATTSARHHLLVRRSLTPNSKGELDLAYFYCHTPQPATLAELVAVVGARWNIEECFQAAKNEVGLDHYQVRKWDPWHRHITLAMLAHAFLAVTAARERRGPPRRATDLGRRRRSRRQRGGHEPVDNNPPPRLMKGAKHYEAVSRTRS